MTAPVYIAVLHRDRPFLEFRSSQKATKKDWKGDVPISSPLLCETVTSEKRKNSFEVRVHSKKLVGNFSHTWRYVTATRY